MCGGKKETRNSLVFLSGGSRAEKKPRSESESRAKEDLFPSWGQSGKTGRSVHVKGSHSK